MNTLRSLLEQTLPGPDVELIMEGIAEDAVVVTVPSGCRLVAMSDQLFRELGADSVDWGRPVDGVYVPTVYRRVP